MNKQILSRNKSVSFNELIDSFTKGYLDSLKELYYNLEKNNNIENLTIKAENCRYAVHDESNNSYQDYIRKMKNVKILLFLE